MSRNGMLGIGLNHQKERRRAVLRLIPMGKRGEGAARNTGGAVLDLMALAVIRPRGLHGSNGETCGHRRHVGGSW